ncbi:hypothetical protein FHU13_000811 [Methylobacterium sp. R2-1]|nr:hypothetical protein [Methylobacterium sp. R2-1]
MMHKAVLSAMPPNTVVRLHDIVAPACSRTP